MGLFTVFKDAYKVIFTVLKKDIFPPAQAPFTMGLPRLARLPGGIKHVFK
ncbi:hypothetical protein ISF68_07240 [Burkholderia pseudomallei]|nr:hypothetical protein [Burkholderia pseudomallei]